MQSEGSSVEEPWHYTMSWEESNSWVTATKTKREGIEVLGYFMIGCPDE